MPDALRLYLVADPDHVAGALVPRVREALAGGVTMVQLRAKASADRDILELARALKAVCDERGVPLVVNDRVDIALAAGAAGVHLGVHDLPLEDARRIAGPDLLIGFSPETDEQIMSARARGADYLGIGPIFGTATKADAGDALGLKEFARRCQLSPLPVVGIGGITLENAASVPDHGAAGIAAISAILSVRSPRSAASSLHEATLRATTNRGRLSGDPAQDPRPDPKGDAPDRR